MAGGVVREQMRWMRWGTRAGEKAGIRNRWMRPGMRLAAWAEEAMEWGEETEVVKLVISVKMNLVGLTRKKTRGAMETVCWSHTADPGPGPAAGARVVPTALGEQEGTIRGGP